MIRKLVFWCLVFMLTGSALASTGRFAYVLRYDKGQEGWKEYLVKFDVEKDEILEEAHLPDNSGYNNFVVDEAGGCYIAKYRTPWRYGRDIYYYNPGRKETGPFVNLGNIFGPRYMVLTKKELIVEVRGNDETRLKSGVVFINRKTKKITDKVFIRKDNSKYTQVNFNDMFFDEINSLFLTTFYVESDKSKPLREVSAYGDIYVIDIKNKKITRIIKMSKEYLYAGGICNIGDKIYVAAAAKGKRRLDGWVPPNTELLVFSLKEGKLVKKIKISPHPYKLAYDPSVNKLYVQHMDDKEARNSVEIIDTTSDEVIGKLEIPSQLMFSVVKPGKMYITVGQGFLTKSRTKPALLVLDTKTDKIIKKFYGNYKGISVNTLN